MSIQSDSHEVERAPRRHQFRFTLEDGSYADAEPDRFKRNLKLAITGIAVVAAGALLIGRAMQRPALTSQPETEPTATSNYVAPSKEQSRDQAVSVQASATASATAEAQEPDVPGKPVATTSPEPAPKAALAPVPAAKTPATPAAPVAKAPRAPAPAAAPVKDSDNPYADAPKRPPAATNTDNPY